MKGSLKYSKTFMRFFRKLRKYPTRRFQTYDRHRLTSRQAIQVTDLCRDMKFLSQLMKPIWVSTELRKKNLAAKCYPQLELNQGPLTFMPCMLLFELIPYFILVQESIEHDYTRFYHLFTIKKKLFYWITQPAHQFLLMLHLNLF